MIQLSERLLAMEESATIAMSRKSRELKAQGKDVISLSLGEPDFNTPQFIKDAATEAMENNFTKYMPVPGYDDLRESISNKFKRDNNLNYDKDQIVVSTGAKIILFSLFKRNVPIAFKSIELSFKREFQFATANSIF